jgi:uncharacterized delta-60 repeat protein
MVRLVTGVAVAALMIAPPAMAAPGDLDPSFGSGGTSPAMGVGYGWGTDLNEPVLKPDGKVLMFGQLSNNAAVIRLTSDGDFDKTFDVDGIAVLDGGGDEIAHSAAILPDGRIAVVGVQFLGMAINAAVWMLKPNGGATNSVNDGLDPSFDVDGAAGLGAGGQSMANAVSVLPDQSLLVAGRTAGDGAVWHVKAGGGTQNTLNDALDPGFGSGGVARLDFGGPDVAWDLATRPDGKILAAGQTTAGVGGDAYVSRLTAGGQPDLSFDVDGHAGFDNGGADVARDLELLPDGRILLAGTSTAANARAVVWRVKPNGGVSNTPNNALDTTFGAQGQITALDTPDEDRARSVVRQSDGKLLVGINSATAAVTNERTTIRRITGDGAPDLSYGAMGRVELVGWIYGMALLPDQRLVLSRESATVSRLLPDTPVLTVARTGSGTGTVTSAPDGIACGATCSSPFAFGTQVAVAAQPDPGSAFAGWSGACSGTTACQLPMTASRDLTARFERGFGRRTRVTLALPRRIGPRAIRVRVRNTNSFTVTGTLRGRARGRLGPKRLVVRPHATAKKALQLPKRARKVLKRTGKLKIRLTARIADPQGTVRKVTRTFRVKKRP